MPDESVGMRALNLLIGGKAQSLFNGCNGIGAISGCPTKKSYGLLCFTKNLNYALDVVADRTPVNTAVYQNTKFRRRCFALVQQLIVVFQGQFDGDFHSPRLVFSTRKRNGQIGRMPGGKVAPGDYLGAF